MSNEMKKLLLVIAVLFSGAFLSSCSDDFLDGFTAGYDGYTYIGTYSSSSACSSACESYGYDYYRYNTSLNNCYCK